MSKLEENNVKFSEITNDNIVVNKKIAATNYQIDENDNITFHKPIINAIDIDWNNATINNIGPIKTTSDLLNVIKNRGGGDINSIPLYDDETVNELSENNSLPKKYISFDHYNSDNNLGLIQQLMFTVNELNKEVQKLRNTFIRGIYSYNGEATYMSNVVGQYGDDEEPLWAIDESEYCRF